MITCSRCGLEAVLTRRVAQWHVPRDYGYRKIAQSQAAIISIASSPVESVVGGGFQKFRLSWMMSLFSVQYILPRSISYLTLNRKGFSRLDTQNLTRNLIDLSNPLRSEKEFKEEMFTAPLAGTRCFPWFLLIYLFINYFFRARLLWR